MGQRILMVNCRMLVAFLQGQDGAIRDYSIANPLPDDVEIAGYVAPELDGCPFGIKLESQSWLGDSTTPLDSPNITVRYYVPVAVPESREGSVEP